MADGERERTPDPEPVAHAAAPTTAVTTPAGPTALGIGPARGDADFVGQLRSMGPAQRAASVQRMHRGAGNQAVARLLNPDLAAITAARQQRLTSASALAASTPQVSILTELQAAATNIPAALAGPSTASPAVAPTSAPAPAAAGG